MPFLATGLSHHLAPLPVRERLHLDEAQIVEALRALVGHAGLTGAVCLSTCNRTEFYVTTWDDRQSQQATARFFHYFSPGPAYAELIYSHPGRIGLHHTFRVASGLDSVVLGEAQVLAQFKRAHRLAQQAGTIDAELDLVMRRAVETAKRVRTSTGISRQAVGYGQAAISIAKGQLGDLTGRGVVIVGAGSIGSATARLLKRAGAAPLFVVRRGHKAEALAQALGAELVELAQLPELAHQVRLIVSSTSSEDRVLSESLISEVRLAQGPDECLLILDLAVPRDVDPDAAQVAGVTLLDLDQLGEVIRKNLSQRESHRPAAEAVVEAAISELELELGRRAAVPLITALVDRAELVRQGELARTLSRMRPLSEEERAHLDRLTQAIAAKLLHHPIAFLRQHADDPERRHLVEEAFGLEGARDD
ncbi:MAG TPA: glutamyl-tRNA reductase [Candidatus Dormibacteraeota bacterium]|nr:glutamyl-tRNA reductase [Candidatus Dormibacteraeota bacterium]